MSGRQAKRQRRPVAASRKELVRGITGAEAGTRLQRLGRRIRGL